MSTRVKPLPHPPGALWMHRCTRCDTVHPTLAGQPGPAACTGCGTTPLPEIKAGPTDFSFWAGGGAAVERDIVAARAKLAARQREADERERKEREARRARLARALLRQRRG